MLALTKKLFRDVAIYGVGDVATSIVSFLLLPVYTRILTNADLGILGLLVSIEAASKIVLRWGADAAFMRLYYECRDTRSRQTLASSLWLFMLAVNAPPFVAAWAMAPWLSRVLFDVAGQEATLRIFFLNTFLMGFFFIPFTVYRIEGRTRRFASLTFSRAAGTVVMRLVAVVGLRLGVFGMVAADLVVTLAVGAALAPMFVALFRPRFSLPLVREALALGLPRVPHGLAHQVIATADRWILRFFVTIDDIGIYSTGVSMGLGMKLFLSAFEYAWAPFYLEAMAHPEAKQIYSRMTTYVVAILALLATGLAATAGDLVKLMTAPKIHAAAVIVPWIGLGVALQGFYQLTAIGLAITKRMASLPIATGIAMTVAVVVNFLLVPRFGMLGAAWTYAASYAALAAAGYVLSQRVYPVQYEWRRLGQIAVAAIAVYVTAVVAVPQALPTLLKLLVRGALVVALFPIVLHLIGFFRPGELQTLVQLRGRLRRVDRQPAGEEVELGGEIASPPSIVDAAPTLVDQPDAAQGNGSSTIE